MTMILYGVFMVTVLGVHSQLAVDTSTYPTFAKGDPTLIHTFTPTDSSEHKKSVLETLESKDKWIMLHSSYAFNVTSVKCITLQVKDAWFNYTMISTDGSTAYNLLYKVNETEHGIEGQTDPENPDLSWNLMPIFNEECVQCHYIYSATDSASEAPPRGDVLIEAGAGKGFFIRTAANILSNTIMNHRFNLTFTSHESCFN